MSRSHFRCIRKLLLLAIVSLCLMVQQGGAFVFAAPVENPQSGSLGIQGKIPSDPPKAGATITSPSSGQSFSKTPVTVAGLCPSGLLVKVFSNNVFMGSVPCTNGSYSLQIDLFSGRNDLIARVFDSLDQAGPDSNIVTVTFNDPQFSAVGGDLLTLTSSYAQRGANPGDTLTWPVILTGGTSPYALSIDWGDNKTDDLMSVSFPGTIDLSHVYDTAGVYRVVIRATDKNGLTAFLQVVAVANGAITSNVPGKTDQSKQPDTRVSWAPAAIAIPLIFLAFWLGGKYELATLRKHLEQQG